MFDVKMTEVHLMPPPTPMFRKDASLIRVKKILNFATLAALS